MSVRIIALATVVEIRDIPTCFEFMGACSVAPHTGSRAARKVFSYYACTCHEGRASLFISLSLSYPARVTGDLCESRYSSVIARVPNLERYISGAKKKYVRIRREGSRWVEGRSFLAEEVENELLALIPCQVTLRRAIRKARDSHFLTGIRGGAGKRVKTLSAQSDKWPLDMHEYTSVRKLYSRNVCVWVENFSLKINFSMAQRLQRYVGVCTIY